MGRRAGWGVWRSSGVQRCMAARASHTGLPADNDVRLAGKPGECERICGLGGARRAHRERGGARARESARARTRARKGARARSHKICLYAGRCNKQGAAARLAKKRETSQISGENAQKESLEVKSLGQVRE